VRLGVSGVAVLLAMAPTLSWATDAAATGSPETFVPVVTLPTHGGGARPGEGGSQRGEATSDAVSAERFGVTDDLPGWLGNETG